MPSRPARCPFRPGRRAFLEPQLSVHRIRGPDRPGQTWATFLENHRSQIWACDFLQLYDIWFRPIFAFFIVDVGSRRVVQVGVTRNPDTAWVAQQLRNATPCGAAPRFIIRDNDNCFGQDFDRAATAVGVRVLRTAPRAPKMNSYCERFLGSARRECLDHIFILGERHLEHVLREYCFEYFNPARSHQGIGQFRSNRLRELGERAGRRRGRLRARRFAP